MARKKTNLFHIRDKEKHEVTREVGTNKLFIKGTDKEVKPNQVCKQRNIKESPTTSNQRPFVHEDLGDEWDDYAWTADDL